MGLFDYFKENRKSANIAKERLSILIARDRSQRDQPSFLPMMQNELLEVINKYVKIDRDDFTVSLDTEGDCEILEFNIPLSEDARR
jgi:cell division topological specificity factor